MYMQRFLVTIDNKNQLKPQKKELSPTSSFFRLEIQFVFVFFFFYY